VAANALANRKASEGEFEVNMVDLKEHSKKGYKGVDDAPYGGGAGMVMRADVLKQALFEGVFKPGKYQSLEQLHVVYTAPRGRTWENEYAKEFAANYLDFKTDKDVVFVCGRYEGVDERFLEKYVDEFISLGDYILTGGELAVMTILDSALRFVPGVLGNKLSAVEESFQNANIEHPLYTRPATFEDMEVPSELMSGHHAKIEAFKGQKSAEFTKRFRPDLLKK
jgi:tRNA (guanine37-N1)-methyltransferase